MRVRAITLLETLISLALVALLFALLVPLLQMSVVGLNVSTRVAEKADQIEFRALLRQTYQNTLTGQDFDVRGDPKSIVFYAYQPIAAVPAATTQLVSVSVTAETAEITRVALAADQSVVLEETRQFQLGIPLSFSYLAACVDPTDWRDDWQGPAPVALRLLPDDDGFWPDFFIARPLVVSDGC